MSISYARRKTTKTCGVQIIRYRRPERHGSASRAGAAACTAKRGSAPALQRPPVKGSPSAAGITGPSSLLSGTFLDLANHYFGGSLQGKLKISACTTEGLQSEGCFEKDGKPFDRSPPPTVLPPLRAHSRQTGKLEWGVLVIVRDAWGPIWVRQPGTPRNVPPAHGASRRTPEWSGEDGSQRAQPAPRSRPLTWEPGLLKKWQSPGQGKVGTRGAQGTLPHQKGRESVL